MFQLVFGNPDGRYLTMRQIAILAVLIAIFMPAMALDMPNMVGNWTGSNEGADFSNITSSETSGDFSFLKVGEIHTFVIEEQNGASFMGKKIDKVDQYTERLVGVIGFDNKTISMVDNAGTWYGEMTSPTEMKLYYQETGNDTMRAERGIYTKE